MTSSRVFLADSESDGDIESDYDEGGMFSDDTSTLSSGLPGPYHLLGSTRSFSVGSCCLTFGLGFDRPGGGGGSV